MSAEGMLAEKLGSFLAAQEPRVETRFRDRFECPPSFADLHGKFPSFEWFLSTGSPPRAFGIRTLVGRSPFRLSDLKGQGLQTESIRYPIRPPVKGLVEHYLVAELLAPDRAKVLLCMHVSPEQWYVLDEHRIGK